MGLYLVDWGEECSGGRYAFVEARDTTELFDELDMVGDPFDARWRRWKGGIYLAFNVDQQGDKIIDWGGDELDQSSDTYSQAAARVAEMVAKTLGWRTFSKSPVRVELGERS